MTWEYRRRDGKHEMFEPLAQGATDLARVTFNGLETIDVWIGDGINATVRIPRDMFENVAERLRRDENEELMKAGWNVYDRHGWWRQGEGGAANTREEALRRVRGERGGRRNG